MQTPLMRLQCGCNSYDWGKVGKDSAAAKFAAATPAEGFTVQEDKPYAELWMGTHPSLPSKDVETQRSLLDMVQDNKALMTIEINEKFSDKLPFLFKVLSINKALSIQAHPNKKLAGELRARDPEHYPDDNHKPEMVIAITPFDGLCGFRPLQETAFFLKNVPALRKLVGESEADEFVNAVAGNEKTNDSDKMRANKKALQKVFTAVMTSSPEHIIATANELVAAANSASSGFIDNDNENPSPTNAATLSKLVLRLNAEFPHDIGLFVLFFLNYVELSPGESMFLRADDIHAYLSGDVIECMASSDNVVRAGFTPKFKDVSTLTSMLTFNYAPIEEQKMQPVDYPYVTLNATAYSSNSSSILYDPPIEEFSVIKTELDKAGAKATFEAIAGPSIILCTQGQGTIKVGHKEEEVRTGYVYFVGATAECVLESTGEDGFVTFKAFCELEGKESATKNGSM